MSRPVRHHVFLLSLLLVFSGCTSAVQPGASPSPTPESKALAVPAEPDTESSSTAEPTETSPSTPSRDPYEQLSETPRPLTDPISCSDEAFVDFWALHESAFWASDTVRYSSHVPQNATYLFVAYVDGEIAGWDAVHRRDANDSVNVDGGEIQLTESYEGRHTIRIVLYKDVDQNRSLNVDTDRPCANSNGVVQTSFYAINFSHYT